MCLLATYDCVDQSRLEVVLVLPFVHKIYLVLCKNLLFYKNLSELLQKINKKSNLQPFSL